MPLIVWYRYLALLLGLGLVLPAVTAASDSGLAARLQPCAACHGEQGRAQQEAYYPSIAGKPAGYLRAQLLNFRDGRRQHAVMTPLLAYLSDDYLGEIAAYYAAQQAAPLPPAPKATAQTLELGRALVEQGDPARRLPACTACHGVGLHGRGAEIPGLAGLGADYLAAQLGSWREGVRRAREPDCMARVARALSGAEVGAVATWIASLPAVEDVPPPAPLPPLPMDCGVRP